MMGVRPEITEERLAALAGWCAGSGVELCVLFGSRAKGGGRSESDYDLAVLPVPAPLRRLEWQAALEDMLDGDVDLVTLSSATNPVLGWQIAREGRLVYEARPGLWMAQRARLWHLYNDALPFRRALAESMGRYAQEIRRVP
jgi:predicted nucleotidyltransferase